MIKKLALYAVGVVACAYMTGCNESSSSQSDLTYSSTLVSAFSLKSDSKILNNLDSVYFSIDLVDARIFNADSLPYGTDISRLLVNITTDGCSTVELYVPRENQSDTTINYLTNSTDSIDFSHGDVRLHVVSLDAKAFRDYMISVNVHQVKSDSLTWDKLAMRELPTTMSKPQQQKTVRMGDEAVCLAAAGSNYTIGFSDDPDGRWSIGNLSFGFTPDVNSLSATDDCLYLLSTAGDLYSSVDRGSSWSKVDSGWSHIYGAYGSTLLGVKKIGSQYFHVSYPQSTQTVVPAECPVSDTGTLASVSSDWSVSSQVIFAGGRLADGSMSRAVYGYDGKSWAAISKNFPIKTARTALLNYTVCDVDTVSWRVTPRHVLLALGGDTETGVSKEVYLSRDYGVNWKTADEFLQLPDYVPAMGGAQPLVFDMNYPLSRAASEWCEYPARQLPAWAKPLSLPASRAIAPIESWECPYIYLFGGYDAAGQLFNTVWRGVLTRLTFKPLQ